MQTLNISDIYDMPNHLLRLADLGEPFIIAQSGKPVAKVLPYSETQENKSFQRIGFLKDFHIADDFDDETDKEIMTLFAGSDDEILA